LWHLEHGNVQQGLLELEERNGVSRFRNEIILAANLNKENTTIVGV